jgi:hypothetical protein
VSLPDLPSALIRAALDDLREVEASEDYRVDMGIWHVRTRPGGPCMVCLAGAVMAKSLGLGAGSGDYSSHNPGDFPEEKVKLMALEWFRCGEVGVGLRQMSQDRKVIPLGRHVVEIPNYDTDPEGFHAALRSMADGLEKEGL